MIAHNRIPDFDPEDEPDPKPPSPTPLGRINEKLYYEIGKTEDPDADPGAEIQPPVAGSTGEDGFNVELESTFLDATIQALVLEIDRQVQSANAHMDRAQLTQAEAWAIAIHAGVPLVIAVVGGRMVVRSGCDYRIALFDNEKWVVVTRDGEHEESMEDREGYPDDDDDDYCDDDGEYDDGEEYDDGYEDDIKY